MTTRRGFIKKTLGYSVLSVFSGGFHNLTGTKRVMRPASGPFGLPGDPLAEATGLTKNIMVGLPASSSSRVRPRLPFYSGFTGDQFPQLAHFVLPNKQQYLPATEIIDLPSHSKTGPVDGLNRISLRPPWSLWQKSPEV